MLPAALSFEASRVTHTHCIQYCVWVTFTRLFKTWNGMQLSNVGRHLFICLQIVWKLSENSDHLSKTLCVVLVRNSLCGKEQCTYINQVRMICSLTVCVGVCYWGKSFVLLNITKTSYTISHSPSSLLFPSHTASKYSFSFSGQIHELFIITSYLAGDCFQTLCHIIAPAAPMVRQKSSLVWT